MWNGLSKSYPYVLQEKIKNKSRINLQKHTPLQAERSCFQQQWDEDYILYCFQSNTYMSIQTSQSTELLSSGSSIAPSLNSMEPTHLIEQPHTHPLGGTSSYENLASVVENIGVPSPFICQQSHHRTCRIGCIACKPPAPAVYTCVWLQTRAAEVQNHIHYLFSKKSAQNSTSIGQEIQVSSVGILH